MNSPRNIMDQTHFKGEQRKPLFLIKDFEYCKIPSVYKMQN